MQMKCRKYPCEEKISKNVLETNLKQKNEILEILSEKDILEITIKNAEKVFKNIETKYSKSDGNNLSKC